MTDDDVLFGFRLRLFALAAAQIGARGLPGVRGAPLDLLPLGGWSSGSGLEVLRPRERRRPRMPNQTPQHVEQRILAFSLGHPGLGPTDRGRARPGEVGRPRVSAPTASGGCCAATG